jgi:hypothetical protein
MRNTDELEKLVRGEDIVKYITAPRIKRWGYLKGKGHPTTGHEDPEGE